jgi:hypothetical protein
VEKIVHQNIDGTNLGIYPLVITNIAIENGDENNGFTH